MEAEIQKYNIKWGPELAWAVGIALALALLQSLLVLDFAEVMQDPRAWAINAFGAGIRVAAAIVLNTMRSAMAKGGA